MERGTAIDKAKRGYVLLTVLCVFAFLCVLGFTLLTAALAGQQSSQRKLLSAQADAYAVSLVDSVNGMVESGSFAPLIESWKQEFLTLPIPEGQTSLYVEKGSPHALSVEELDLAAALGDSSGNAVRLSGECSLSNVTVQKRPEGTTTCSGTLQADWQVTCVLNGREVSFLFHSEFLPVMAGDGSGETGRYSTRTFEKRRDYHEI